MSDRNSLSLSSTIQVFGGLLPRARLEGCLVKGKRSWTQTQEAPVQEPAVLLRPGQRQVVSPLQASVSLSIIVCVPNEAAVAGIK